MSQPNQPICFVKRSLKTEDISLYYLIVMISKSQARRSDMTVGSVLHKHYPKLDVVGRKVVRQLLSDKRPHLMMRASGFLANSDYWNEASQSNVTHHDAVMDALQESLVA